MKFSLLSLLIFSIAITNTNGQSDNYIKLDAIRLVYPAIGLTYETRNEKRGLEIEIIYDFSKATVTKAPEFNYMTMVREGEFEQFKFAQTQMEIIFSYKKYFALIKKENRAYYGVFNRNKFALNIDDDYYLKYQEIFGSTRAKEETFNKMIIGPTAGISIPIADHFIFEAGIGMGIDLLNSFGDSGILFDFHLPFLIGYKF